MWERSFKQVSISSKSKSKVCGVWTRTLLSFLCLKIYFLLLIYMILQVGLHPNFFIYDLWDLSWISLIFMIISPSCFLNWEFIPWVVYCHYVLMISKRFKTSVMSYAFPWEIWLLNIYQYLRLKVNNESYDVFLKLLIFENDSKSKCTWCWERLCWVESS